MSPHRLDPFDFDLPESRIALRPARPRDAARLLVVRADGRLEDRIVRDLPGLLHSDDLLVVNDTRVVAAALDATRPARGDGVSEDVRVDVNLHDRAGPDAWRAFLRPAKRVRAGDELSFAGALRAAVVERGEGGDALLRFDRTGPALDAAIAAVGAPPLPPYIARKREPDAADVADYQTVFAADPGSAAAPTAGLHFTPGLLDALSSRGVARTAVTLHVGAGTFAPLTDQALAEGRLHTEWCRVSPEAETAMARARGGGRAVVAVGTTAIRTLETAALRAGLTADGAPRAFAGETDLFIQPGFRFQAADRLLTNFHLPRSSLFMLVCAFAGLEVMQAAYAHAVRAGYRFFSYGDACLLEPAASGRAA